MAKQSSLIIDGGYGDNVASTIIDLTGDEPKLFVKEKEV